MKAPLNEMNLTAIQWFMNGSELATLDTPNVKIVFRTKLQLGVVIFHNLTLDFNVTTIYCRAEFEYGKLVVNSTDVPTLFVQGMTIKA